MNVNTHANACGWEKHTGKKERAVTRRYMSASYYFCFVRAGNVWFVSKLSKSLSGWCDCVMVRLGLGGCEVGEENTGVDVVLRIHLGFRAGRYGLRDNSTKASSAFNLSTFFSTCNKPLSHLSPSLSSHFLVEVSMHSAL